MSAIEEFEKLFKTNYSRFVSVSYSYTHLKEVAEEVVQDVFVDFWARLQRNEKILNHEAYLRRAIVFRSLNVIKKERKHTQKENLDYQEQLIPDKSHNPEDLIIGHEELQHLQDQINQLPDKTRQVFMLSRFEKLSYAEIAEHTNTKVKTVEYHITKALSILRKAIYTVVLVFNQLFF